MQFTLLKYDQDGDLDVVGVFGPAAMAKQTETVIRNLRSFFPVVGMALIEFGKDSKFTAVRIK